MKPFLSSLCNIGFFPLNYALEIYSLVLYQKLKQKSRFLQILFALTKPFIVAVRFGLLIDLFRVYGYITARLKKAFKGIEKNG